MSTFPDLLKHWRKLRRLSQLDLALEAEVSGRHISFLETGRARPSRDMIGRLGEVLKLPLDARNLMFTAMDFAPRYPSTPLDAAVMAPIRSAMEHMLEGHAPFPGIALDRLWRVQRMNAPAAWLFAPFGLVEGDSLLALLKSDILLSVVENWSEVAHHSALRLRAESLAGGGLPELEEAAQYLSQFADPTIGDSAPVIPTVYLLGDQRLSLIGTIAQFSTVNDQTVDDLKLELFFPADPESDALLREMADQR